MKRYITLRITFGEEGQAKEIKVRYLVIDSPSLYNMIIGQLAINWMGSNLSTLYLCMKYPFPNAGMGYPRRSKDC